MEFIAFVCVLEWHSLSFPVPGNKDSREFMGETSITLAAPSLCDAEHTLYGLFQHSQIQE